MADHTNKVPVIKDKICVVLFVIVVNNTPSTCVAQSFENIYFAGLYTAYIHCVLQLKIRKRVFCRNSRILAVRQTILQKQKNLHEEALLASSVALIRHIKPC